ncbi:MAG: hypothetical protein AB9835_02470 [Eubacteriales bacterium]
MCGLFGFSDCGGSLSTVKLNDLTEALAIESAVRGSDATGISYMKDGRLRVEKEAKSAYHIEFNLPSGVRHIIGHTRHTTQGNAAKKYNNHPFIGKTSKDGFFSLCHNGIIANDALLRRMHELPRTKIETDSYVAVQLLEQNKRLSFDSMGKMAEQIDGSFSFSILDEKENIYLIRGDSPLSVIYLTKLKTYVYASTDQILWRALSSCMLSELKSGHFEEVDINEGMILRISQEGKLTFGEFKYHPSLYNYRYTGWHNSFLTQEDGNTDNDYIDSLKSMSSMFGYTPDDIDYLIGTGFSPDEIEDLMYSGENCYALNEL